MSGDEAKLFGDIEVEKRSVPFGQWLWLIFAWDGVLPFIVVGLPMLVRWAWPAAHGLKEFVCIVLPIVAFFFRFAIGLIHISRNRCGTWMRTSQRVVLFFAVFFFVVFDIMLIESQDIAMQGIRMRPSEQLFIATLYLSYLMIMAFALYPGKRLVMTAPYQHDFRMMNDSED